MKYSFMTFSCPGHTFEELVGLAQRFGYDGVELRIEADHRHGIELGAPAERLSAARRHAAERGIALSCVATSRRYADPETRAKEVELTRRCIDLAAAVGSPCIRVFGGLLPPGVTREAATDLLVDALSAVADYAQQHELTVCIETHDDWCDPQHLAVVMERVSHPAIGTNWDVAHPVNRAGVSIPDSFSILSRWIRHCHVHDLTPRTPDGRQSLIWIGEGIVDHREAIRLLHSIGYQGHLSGEWIDRDPGFEEHLPRELATLKRYEQELGMQ